MGSVVAGCLNRRNPLPLAILVGLPALLLSLLAPSAAAADLQGRVAALNLPKQTIALRIADHERSFALAKSCRVYQLAGARKESGYAPVHDGLKAITVGDQVSATTDRIDDREEVIRIKIETPPKKRGRHVGHDISGRVAVFDAARRLISLSETDKDEHYELAKDCNVFQLVGKGSRGRFSCPRRPERRGGRRRSDPESRNPGGQAASRLYRDRRGGPAETRKMTRRASGVGAYA